MKQILVAGATDYPGGFVAREFKSQGYFVRALGDHPKTSNTSSLNRTRLSPAKSPGPYPSPMCATIMKSLLLFQIVENNPAIPVSIFRLTS